MNKEHAKYYSYDYLYGNKTSAGLSRIYTHVKSGPFALVGAFKGTARSPENYRRSAMLGKRIREILPKNQSGYLPVTGHWKSSESGEMYIEPSYFIPGISFETAKQLSKEFDQEAFIWGDKGDWASYDTNTLEPIGSGSDLNFNFDKEQAQAYSEYKSKGFKLSESRESIVNVVNHYVKRNLK